MLSSPFIAEEDLRVADVADAQIISNQPMVYIYVILLCS